MRWEELVGLGGTGRGRRRLAGGIGWKAVGRDIDLAVRIVWFSMLASVFCH